MNQYQIYFINLPIIIDNKYYQEILFNDTIINYNIFDCVYDIDNNKYNYTYLSNKYYIISDNYIINNFKYIYTIQNNYIVKITSDSITNKFNDNYINNYINNQINTIYYFKLYIKLSQIINNNNNKYLYKLIDYTNNINFNQKKIYSINTIYNKIKSINIDENNIILNELLSIDNLNNYITTDLYLNSSIDKDFIYNEIHLFNNIKEFRNNLLSFINSDILINIYYNLKPWKNVNSDIESWKKILEIYNDYISEKWNFNKYGFGRLYLQKRYNIAQGTARTFMKLIKNNWNPLLDNDFLAFINDNIGMS